MNLKKIASLVLLIVSISTVTASNVRPSAGVNIEQATPSEAEFMTAEELKTKMARNELVTVIDVRDTKSLVGSENKIRGSIHVKLRRLAYRLSFPPLKNISRDSEVVTYCACPNDESSRHAAQILLDAGFKHVYVLKGGWQMWLKVNGKVEPRAKAG